MSHAWVAHSPRHSEERRENGLGLITLGFMLWFFDAMVFFFMPVSERTGQAQPFVVLIAAAFVAGSALVAVGMHLRR